MVGELKKPTSQEMENLTNQLKKRREELEIQNEELRRAQIEIEENRRMFSDLFEFAPVGYFVFDQNGIIQSVNLTGAQILGWDKKDILNKPFLVFILREDKDLFLGHSTQISQKHVNQTVLRVIRKDNSILNVQLQSRMVEGREGNSGFCRTAMIDITDRKQAEEMHRQSEEKLNALINAAGESIWLFSTDDTILAANKTSARRLNHNPTALVGKKWTDYVPPELAAARRERIEEVIKTGKALDFEDERAGTLFRHSFYPVQDSAGKVVAIASFSRDITGRRKIEKELQEQKIRLQLVLDSGNIGIHEWNISTGELTWDDRAYDLFELPRGTIVTLDTFIKAIHPDDLAATQAAMDQALNPDNKKRYHVEFRIITFGSRIQRWLEATGYVVFSGDQPVRLIGATWDISERKKREEALDASEKRYRSFIEATGELGWVTNANGEVDEDIPSFRRYTGQTYEEVKGWGWSTALHPDDFENTKEIWTKAVQEKTRYEIEYRLRRYDGAYRSFFARGVPVFAKNRDLTEWVGTCIDITERKQAEEAIEEARRSVERERNLLQAMIDSATNSHLVYLDRDFNFIRVNEAYAKTCGYAPKDMVGKNHFALYPHQENKSIFARVRDSGVPVEFHDKPFTFPDQPERGITYWDWTLTPVKDPSGYVEGLVFSLFETTERKRNEELLRARSTLIGYVSSHTSDELLRKSLDEISAMTESPVGFCHFVAEDQKTVVLQTWSTRTEREFCKAEGKGLHYPIDQAGVWVDCVKAREPVVHNDYLSLPHRKGMPEGHPPILRELVVPVLRHGRIVAILGVGNKPWDYTRQDVELVAYLADVTWEAVMRRRAEEELREREEAARQRAEELQKIMDFAPTPIWVSQDPQCRSIVGNKAADRLFETESGQNVSAGTTDGEVLNTEIRFFRFGQELKPEELPMQLAASREEDVLNYEMDALLPSGRRITKLGNASPLFDDQGRVRGCVGVYMDITERKLIENTQQFLAQTGDKDFFEALARYLGEALGMDYVCIDRLVGEGLSARTLAIYFDGKFEDNVTYALKDTPCGEVVKQKICIFLKDVRHLFPRDQVLQDMKAESYLGTLLRDSKGRPIGLIALIGRKPLENENTGEAILRLAGVRAASELERRQAEEALLEAKELFEKTFTSQLDAIFLLDANIPPKIIDCNPAAVKMFGYGREEILGSTTSALHVSEGALHRFQRILYPKIEEQGYMQLSDFEMKRKDGEIFPTENSVIPLRDDKGRRTGWLSVIRDISDRKRAEEALKKSEAGLARAQAIAHLANWEVQVGPDGILGTEDDTVRGSAELYRMFNLEEDHNLGAYIDRVHPDDRACVVESIQATIYKGQPYNIDFRILPRAGEVRNVHAEGEAIRDETGVPIQFFGTVQDITERKRAEEQLKKAHDELETRVQERTAELSRAHNQIRFFASQYLNAQEKERRRIAGELHDSVISSLVGIKIRIERTALNLEKGRAEPEFLTQSATRITDIIDEIRRIMADLRPAILDDLGLESALNWFCREYQKTHSHISVKNQISGLEVPDSLRTPIFRITQEAFNNIAKYSQASLVNFSLSEEDGHIVLFIEDNGRGFDPEKVRKGLGLSTMRERAELSGGSFHLESAEGKGSIIRALWSV